VKLFGQRHINLALSDTRFHTMCSSGQNLLGLVTVNKLQQNVYMVNML